MKWWDLICKRKKTSLRSMKSFSYFHCLCISPFSPAEILIWMKPEETCFSFLEMVLTICILSFLSKWRYITTSLVGQACATVVVSFYIRIIHNLKMRRSFSGILNIFLVSIWYFLTLCLELFIIWKIWVLIERLAPYKLCFWFYG